MKLKDIIQFLESRAPLALQENYDNSGLITGHPEMEITGAVICLDSTEDVIDEAISRGFNLVIAHHPILFSGLKKLTGKNYVERALIKSIRHGIALYAIHTNLDSTPDGVNRKIAERLGLRHLSVLSPKSAALRKLVVFVPTSHAEQVRNALFQAGAGHIGRYDECSFSAPGSGTFRGNADSRPYVGESGKRHTEQEMRLEVILPSWLVSSAVQRMREAHPYEEVAYEVYAVDNKWEGAGSGMIGELPGPLATMEFLDNLKSIMRAGAIRYTRPVAAEVSKVAVCGGSGSFLIPDAIAAGADVLVTADLKYHQFFDADGSILLADIGHFESEQFTIDLLYEWLAEKFPTFATHKTGVTTNPIHYL